MMDSKWLFRPLVANILSLVAFILEETVTSCISCHPLYFFEFVSCTAFLFTTLLFILLSTTLHEKVGISCWLKVVFGFMAMVAFCIDVFFFVKTNGVPFRREPTQPTTNGVVAQQEAEKLNGDASAAP
ncbi:hypothetical protein GOODEAATRI_022823 [Goodea atripinnis]|uniref:CKLF-like MARVEL transmembrane domain-containing protein 6 n=1 Tax=Goodea atripinnis TaxID=208336 RepID=A0ABV0N3N0_9TELE